MKIRNGFVSNSSSSSFMIMGRWLDDELENTDDLEEQGVFFHNEDESGPCVGVDFDIEDNETWGDYKARVAKVLTEAGIACEPDDIQLCYGSEYR